MKRLVLLGGGHAHVKVLADLAERPLAGWDVHLVSPYRRQIYSGMLPGWVAGHYPIGSCAIALDTLAAKAGVAFHETAGLSLDTTANEIACADGTRLPFDLLSIDTGPLPAIDQLPGSAEHGLPVRPIEHFVLAWPGLVDRMLGRCRRFDLVILGSGAGGVELALAAQYRAMTDGWSHVHVTLVGSDELPLEGSAGGARRRVARILAQRGLTWLGERRAVRLEASEIEFERGPSLGFDACLVVTGAAAPAWPRAAGLATDERGFIRVGRTLQSVSHPHVFAAGDVAAYVDARPKSGVYAVKAGPVLSENLRAVCEGRAPRGWTPQRRALYLISTGGRYAIALWGPWSAGGAWVWAWKDRIDRAFVRRFGTAARSPRLQRLGIGQARITNPGGHNDVGSGNQRGGRTMLMLKWLLIALAVLTLGGIGAGQAGLFRGSAPTDLGVQNGKLKPPSATDNSVSSQAALYPEHARHEAALIAALPLRGDGPATIARIKSLIQTTSGATIVKGDADYLYAQYTTPLMHFVDDVEFWYDPVAQAIQVRSASRIGESDMGVNRKRVEAVRAALAAAP